MNKFLQWLLNLSAGLFFFFFFVFIFFPFENVIQHYLSGIEQATGGHYRVTVGEIDPSVFFKTRFKDFKLFRHDDTGDKELLALPELKIGFRFLPLITGDFEASFILSPKKGEMAGQFSISSSRYEIDASLDKLRLEDFPYLADVLHIPLEGVATGKIDLDYYPKTIPKSEGTIDLKFSGLKIPAGRLTPYPGFDIELPETALALTQDAVIALAINQGSVDIKSFNFPGDDLILDLKGKIQLNRHLDLSRVNAQGIFKISDKLAQAVPLVVMLDKQKNEEGAYPVTLSGRLSKPSLQIGTFDVF